MRYAFLKPLLSAPAPGSEGEDIPSAAFLPAIPTSVRTLGTSEVWGEGSAGLSLMMGVWDPQLEGEGQGAGLQPRISERPLRFWVPGLMGSSCREAAFDPLGGALIELAPVPALF